MATVWHEDGSRLALRDDELRQVALGMLQARRAMRGTLPEALIHDVPLELLLSVFVAPGGDIALEWLVGDTTVPPDNARRWLAALVSEDLVIVSNARVSLTESGSARMEGMLTSVVRSQRELLGWAHH